MKRVLPELNLRYSKRHKESSSSSSSSSCCSERPRCRYHGCNRPCYRKAPGMYYDFCGKTHANMYMAEARDSAEYDIIMPDNCLVGDKKCSLRGCKSLVEKSSARGHEFCCVSHMLEYISLSTALYKKVGRLCKIEHCFRHVYVENGRCHDFCGLKHAKLAAAAKGAGANIIRILPEESGEQNSNSDYDRDQHSRDPRLNSSREEEKQEEKQEEKHEEESYRLPQVDDNGHSGFEGGISDHQLKQYLIAAQEKLLEEYEQGKPSDNNPNKVNIFERRDGEEFRKINIFQGGDISKSHPWEISTEHKPRYIFFITDQRKVSRKTRDGWSWKQTGRPYSRPHSVLARKYFSYKDTRKPGVSSKEQKKYSWTLHEYSLEEKFFEDLTKQKGVDKTGKIRRPAILKIFPCDNATPIGGDEGDLMSHGGNSDEGDLTSQGVSGGNSVTDVPKQSGSGEYIEQQRHSPCEHAVFDGRFGAETLTVTDMFELQWLNSSSPLEVNDLSWCEVYHSDFSMGF